MFIMDAYQEREMGRYKSTWEQTRILSYYLYINIPKKNRNPSMSQFKREHMPFDWDAEALPEAQQPTTQEVLDDWEERFKKIKEAGVAQGNADITELEKLK